MIYDATRSFSVTVSIDAIQPVPSFKILTFFLLRSDTVLTELYYDAFVAQYSQKVAL